MEPAPSLHGFEPDAAGTVVPLRPRARAEELRTPPPHRDGGDVLDGAREANEDDRPASDSEITAEVLNLRGAHPKSPSVVRQYASQLPRTVFAGIIEEVTEGDAYGSVRNPVGLLIFRLRVEIEARTQAAMTEVAGEASARFGYARPSPIERLRNDPERWVKAMAPDLAATEVDEFLRQHVPDEVERHRLRSLADEVRIP